MSNEAAERVKDWIMFQHPNEAGKDMRQKIDAALAAERKATVEQMVEAIMLDGFRHYCKGDTFISYKGITAILDAEAAR